MGLDVARIEPSSFDQAPSQGPRAARPDATGTVNDSAAVSSSEIPTGPPPEVLDAITAAGRVAHELHSQGRELRFVTPAESGGAGRVRIEVRDLDGHVLREIPPSEALDVATGTPLS